KANNPARPSQMTRRALRRARDAEMSNKAARQGSPRMGFPSFVTGGLRMSGESVYANPFGLDCKKISRASGIPSAYHLAFSLNHLPARAASVPVVIKPRRAVAVQGLGRDDGVADDLEHGDRFRHRLPPRWWAAALQLRPQAAQAPAAGGDPLADD